MANVLSLVSYKIFPAKLGGQKGIALFNRSFSKYHQLTCVTIRDNEPSFASYKIINTLSNSKWRYLNIFYFFKLRNIIKENNITHLIVEHPYYGWLGILLKWFCKIKLVVHSHNIESLRFKGLGKWWWGVLWNYERFVHKNAHHTFCVTEEDRQYMISRFKIKSDKCTVITYGIEWEVAPTGREKADAKQFLITKYGLPENTWFFLFNGTLDYGPNLDAVKNIVDHINPILQGSGLKYRIIICGKGLPAEMNELKQYYKDNIIYAGFVDDINVYFKGVDVFINPVVEGGGIKTKLVEALGNNLNTVSSRNGAIGVSEDLCNGKLLLANDNDWKRFAELMQNATLSNNPIPDIFFDHFYWDNITKKAAVKIDNLS